MTDGEKEEKMKIQKLEYLKNEKSFLDFTRHKVYENKQIRAAIRKYASILLTTNVTKVEQLL